MVDVNDEYDKGYEYQDAQLLSQNWTVSLTKDDFKYFTSELHKNLTKPIGEDIVIDYSGLTMIEMLNIIVNWYMIDYTFYVCTILCSHHLFNACTTLDKNVPFFGTFFIDNH